MFGPPGRAYVYLIYGMYDMLNVVTAAEGDPQAVLIRACEPIGQALGRLDGPGRLTRTLEITRDLNNHDLRRPPLWLEPGRPPVTVEVSPRIGVDYAGEWAEAPLRFFDPESPNLSRR
jgi:DNA-3-methyladenine glycosylase